MKRLRILVLLREGLEPPKEIENLDDDAIKAADWKTEYDVTSTIQNLGHELKILPLYSDFDAIRAAVEEWKPDIVFNLLEEFRGYALYDQNVVSYLELMGVSYTGCNPRGLMIARDKALSKKLLAYHRINVPEFAVYPTGRKVKPTRRLKFPLFVKSVVEDASLGISRASLVKDEQSLNERVTFIHNHAGTGAIVEEFIDGRELYVGVIGNTRLETFPVWEFVLRQKPEGEPLIATARAKWNVNYQKKWGVETHEATDLPTEMVREIHRRCRRIYRILGLSGYARLDFRLGADGKLYFLEANPNPNLAFGEDFAESAEKGGMPYPKLIRRILTLGLRWEPVLVT